VVDKPIASSLNGSGCSTAGRHDEVTSDWMRLLSSRGDEGSRRAGPSGTNRTIDMLRLRSEILQKSLVSLCWKERPWHLVDLVD
jgi:hypothetical protein